MSTDTSHFSIEFFPPRTPAGEEKLDIVHAELSKLGPEFFSVTYGAGGSTRERTLRAVLDLRAAGYAAAPHISCIGSSRDDIRDILRGYRENGIRHLVALRGDLPSGTATAGAFRYAVDLIEFVRRTHGDAWRIEVAAYPEYHPQAKSSQDDLASFKRKVEAGADSAITQYFYNSDAYFRLVDEAQALGLRLPIVPGILPITNSAQLMRFSDGCGAEIPRWIRLRLNSLGDDGAAIRAFGLDVVTALCQRLLAGGAPGLHFYTMNQSAATLEICRRLALS